MKKQLYILAFLCIISDHLFSQSTKLVRKDIVVYLVYGGKNKIVPENPNEPGCNLCGDSLQWGLFPYTKKLPFHFYLKDTQSPYSYYYNDIFLANGFNFDYSRDDLQNMKVDPIKMKKEEPVFHLKDAGEKPVYVTYPMLGIVAKMWILDGEWEMHTIKEKPNFIKGLSPTALVFDEYNIHVLKKVISVRPLTEIPDKNTSLEIFKGGQIESYGRK